MYLFFPFHYCFRGKCVSHDKRTSNEFLSYLTFSVIEFVRQLEKVKTKISMIVDAGISIGPIPSECSTFRD